MKIHEYQGKEILRKFGVTVPRGIPCLSVDEAVKAAETLGGQFGSLRRKSMRVAVVKVVALKLQNRSNKFVNMQMRSWVCNWLLTRLALKAKKFVAC
jgi:hypothetical protein